MTGKHPWYSCVSSRETGASLEWWRVLIKGQIEKGRRESGVLLVRRLTIRPSCDNAKR